VYPLDVLPGYLVEVESLWLLVALDCQCIVRQALLYLESNDAVESAELVVGDYSEVDWKIRCRWKQKYPEYRPNYLQHRMGKIKQRIFAKSSKRKISIMYTGTLAMSFDENYFKEIRRYF
jgi:hypothetical protein